MRVDDVKEQPTIVLEGGPMNGKIIEGYTFSTVISVPATHNGRLMIAEYEQTKFPWVFSFRGYAEWHKSAPPPPTI